MEIYQETIDHISSLKKPAVIGISGFGGAGKTTAAKMLATQLSSPYVDIIDFIKPGMDYHSWDIYNFERLKDELILPFLDNENPVIYKVFEPEVVTERTEVTVPNTGLLIIEGPGLFRPELNDLFAYKIWIDVPQEVGIQRGKDYYHTEWHDEASDEMWDGLWKQNDTEYFEKYSPKDVADLIVNNG